MKKKEFANFIIQLDEIGELINKGEEKLTKTQQKELFVIMKALYLDCWLTCNKESLDKLHNDLDKIGDKYGS